MISLYWSEEDTQRNPAGGDALTTVIGRLDIDAVIREERNISSQLTSHAVEYGVPSSDHVVINQEQIPLDCVVSDTPNSLNTTGATNEFVPLPGGGGAVVIKLADATIVKDVFAALKDLVRSGREVDVEGLLEDVESFVITQFSPVIEAGRSGAMFFSLVLTEKSTATVQEVESPSPQVERGRGTRDRGRQRGATNNGATSSNPASTDPADRGSVLSRLRDSDAARQIQQGNYGAGINLIIGAFGGGS